MSPATAEKIRKHKFGRRRLATDSAWNAYNRVARNKPDDEGDRPFTKLLTAIAGSTVIQGFVTAMNTQLGIMATQFGLVPANDQKIKLAAPEEMFIPRSVWFGYVNMPTGSLTQAQRDAFTAAEIVYADNAGLLRSAIARHMAINSALNDAANADESPNPGGTGDPYGT